MKIGRTGRLSRTATRTECFWLDKDYERGTPVSECLDLTYGCIGNGIACYINGKKSFDELPYDAVEWDLNKRMIY